MQFNRALRIFCTALLFGLVSVSNAADKPVHLFVLSGQSNMAGMDPKIGLIPEAEMIFPDATIAFLKVARGGQPIRFWLSDWSDIAKRNGLESKGPNQVKYYQPILDQYRTLLGTHKKFSSVTFCWMQGERDARESLGAAYADALNTLIARLRKDLNQPNMNVVIGRISDFKNPAYPHWDLVRKVQIEVATKDPKGAWVDCDDLNDMTKNGKAHDDLHYTKEGYELLGRRFARQAKALIEGTKPDPNGRPSHQVGAANPTSVKFVPLFDGKTLEGWTPLPGGEWTVENGAIVGRSPKSERRHGMLLSNKQYENFIVQAKFRVHSGDSGFYFRSERVNSAVSVNGFQVEIDTSQETGGLYETGGRAWVHNPSRDKALIEKRKYAQGEWADLELTADGGNLTVKINGVITTELKNDKGRTKGHFGLQLHGGQDMHVEFQDIKIHELK